MNFYHYDYLIRFFSKVTDSLCFWHNSTMACKTHSANWEEKFVSGYIHTYRIFFNLVFVLLPVLEFWHLTMEGTPLSITFHLYMQFDSNLVIREILICTVTNSLPRPMFLLNLPHVFQSSVYSGIKFNKNLIFCFTPFFVKQIFKSVLEKSCLECLFEL